MWIESYIVVRMQDIALLPVISRTKNLTWVEATD